MPSQTVTPAPTGAIGQVAGPFIDGVQTIVPLPATAMGTTQSTGVLWLGTRDNEAGAGSSGTDAWTSGEGVQFDGLGFVLEPGLTDGSFLSVVNFDSFAADSSVKLRGLHFVREDITVGDTTTFGLLRGDLLFSTDNDETFTSTNTKATTSEDVVVFRPDTLGDYSSGTFTILLDDPITGKKIRSIHLVNKDTVVGDTTLLRGTFLLSRSGSGFHNNVLKYVPTEVGEGTTSGTDSILIDGDDLGYADQIQGVHLIEEALVIGGTVLSSGQILLTLNMDNANVGDNNLGTKEEDIFYLDVTETTLVAGTAVANATLLFEGSDVNLDGNDIHSFTLALDEFIGPIVVIGPIITSAEVTAIGSTVNPTVILGSITVSPAPVTAIGATVGPTVLLGSTTAVPVPATAIGTIVDPFVIDPFTPAGAIGTITNPTIILGSHIVLPPPTSASGIGTTVNPTVILGSITLVPTPVTVIGETIDPTVILGSLTIVSIPATVIGETIDPTVVDPETPASAIGTTVDPTIILSSIIVVPASATAIGRSINPLVGDPKTPAMVIGVTIDPSVIFGSMTVTPAVVSAIGEVADPSVVFGSLTLTTTLVSAIGITVDPTVLLGSLSLIPAPVNCGVGTVIKPIVILGSLFLAPLTVTAIGKIADPIVSDPAPPAIGGGETVDPVVILGSLTLTPDPSTGVGRTFFDIGPLPETVFITLELFPDVFLELIT